MRTMIRRAILAGAAAGMTALTITAPALAGAAFAATPSPSPTNSPSPSPSTPVPGAHLGVTITPDKAAPGATVNIKAVAQQGLAKASVQSPVLDSSTLSTSGAIASGTGHVRSDAKAGVYPVLVVATTSDSVKLRGVAKLTIVIDNTTPSPSPTVPKGGVGTGGGGTAGRADLPLIGAGSAIALLGVTAAVAAMRRRRADARH